MASRTPVVVHRHLTLIWCDSAASLAEALTQVDLSDIPHQRFGDRTIALPAQYAKAIHETLREGGTYPRVVGEISQTSDAADEDSEDEDQE